MLKVVEEIGLVNKISLTTIVATAGNTIGSWIGWINENMVHMSAAASFILTIVLILTYILNEIRKNRSHSIETKKQELEIEKLRRELEKLDQKNDEESPN
ncbi:MAG: hypothetical protein ABW044_05430 [Cellvibrio sp.]